MAAPLPKNADLAEQFYLLADLLELEGAESFRVLAYRRAATRMRETSGSIAELALNGRAKELQGIGRTIEEKIVQIVETGTIEALAKKRADVPEGVVQFMRLPGLGPKTAARIWRELGVTTVEELRQAAEAQRLRGLAGLGAKSEEKILKALDFKAVNPDEDRRLLGQGLPAVLAVVEVLREHPAAVHVSEAGSLGPDALLPRSLSAVMGDLVSAGRGSERAQAHRSVGRSHDNGFGRAFGHHARSHGHHGRSHGQHRGWR